MQLLQYLHARIARQQLGLQFALFCARSILVVRLFGLPCCAPVHNSLQ